MQARLKESSTPRMLVRSLRKHSGSGLLKIHIKYAQMFVHINGTYIMERAK